MSNTGRLLTLEEVAALPRATFENACRGVVSPLWLGSGAALCRIIARYKLYVSTDDDGFSGNVLLDGYWESWLTQFMARTVRRGDCVVDVGANYGYYSLLLADLVGPNGRLYAIEPNPGVAELLRRSVLLNGFAGRTQIHETAAGAGAGAATLVVPTREPKNATIVGTGLGPPAGTQSYQVKVAALDDILDAEQRIDFLKIDAEGAEEHIIDGMARILGRQRPAMVLEFNTARYADPAAFLERLLRIYGGLRHIDYDGTAALVSPERVLTEHPGEDWLLYLGGR